MLPRIWAAVLVSICGLLSTGTSFSLTAQGVIPGRRAASPGVLSSPNHAAGGRVPGRRSGVLSVCAKRRAAADGGEERLSKRVKRRNRAPPSQVEAWKEFVSSHGDARIELLLDLDNAADAIEQVEVWGLQERCVMKGFAGVDYNGPTPDWLPIRRCTVRAKNGADFMLAFEAGRIAHEAVSHEAVSHEAVSKGKGGSGSLVEQGVGRTDSLGVDDGRGSGMPMVVIVSSDLAMEVLVSELQHMGLSAHALYRASELMPLGQALREA